MSDTRKLIYNIAASLDGFIAGPEQAVDLYVYEGEHADDYLAAVQRYGAVVMGRRTYEFGLRQGVSDPYPHLDTYVVSRTLTEAPSARVQIVREPIAPFVAALKKQLGADVYLCGGGDLAATLIAAGLVDEVIVKLNPVLVGAGTPLVARLPAPTQLVLASTKVHAQPGVVTLRYLVRR